LTDLLPKDKFVRCLIVLEAEEAAVTSNGRKIGKQTKTKYAK
jgi:hypothetical protein